MYLITLLILYFLAVFLLAWRNFRLAIGFLIIALPTYLIRFNRGAFALHRSGSNFWRGFFSLVN